MIHPDTKLLEKLFSKGIGLDPCEEDTLVLKSVPVHPRYFNKVKTNVLLRYLKPHKQYLVFVDDDLQFNDDKHKKLSRIFKAEEGKNGWRLLHFNGIPVKTPTEAIQRVMETLWAGQSHPVINEYVSGFPESCEATLDEQPILKAHAVNLGKQIATGGLPPTVVRQREMEWVIAVLNKWEHPRLPIIVSEVGMGRTNLIYGVTRQILSANPKYQIFSINLPRLLIGKVSKEEREQLFIQLFMEMEVMNEAVFIMENMDLMLNSCYNSVSILCTALDKLVKIIGTLQVGYEHLFANPVLKRRVQLIPLVEPDREELLEILKALKPILEKHHGIKIMENALTVCVNSTGDCSGKFPAKAIHVLDLACARVRQSEISIVAPDDVVAAVSICSSFKDNVSKS